MKENNSETLKNQRVLIDNVIHGNKSDFITLIEPYYERLYLKIYSIVKNENDAKDILQDALIAAYISLKNFKKESSIYTWLYRIVVNKALDYLKSQKKENQYIDPNYNPYSENLQFFVENILNVPEKKEQNELYEYLMYEIEQLEERYKEILIKRYFDGLTYEEIAEVKNIRIGTVKSRIHKAKELLKKRLVNNKKFFQLD
jgi:RNA polymerase sigma-70 factor (ECF subfamily)